MIIINQRNEIINFKNVVEIYKTFSDNNSLSIEASTINNDYTTLGEYNSEKRANEILEELIESISGKSVVTMNIEKVTSEVTGGIYRMPKE